MDPVVKGVGNWGISALDFHLVSLDEVAVVFGNAVVLLFVPVVVEFILVLLFEDSRYICQLLPLPLINLFLLIL